MGREISDIWLKRECRNIKGNVLSIGSKKDRASNGRKYKSFFPIAYCVKAIKIK